MTVRSLGRAAASVGPLGVDPSGLDPSGLDPSGLDPSGLDPSGLDPSGLDPSGLDPSGLDPSGLDPSGLDPSGVDLLGVDPPGAQASAHRPTTVAAAIRDAAARLLPVADNPRLEARLLLAHALGVERADLVRDRHKAVDATVFDRLVARRQAREPMALILGRQEFWSMEFLVSPATLIPRADTETLVEAALRAFAGRAPPRLVLDLGTGTGCLLLALLREFPVAFGIGVDVAPAAAALARCNAARLGLAGRSAFVCGDWASSLGGAFDLVVCNPPYVAEAEVAGLMPEVARHEPRRALVGGADGCAAYRAILPRLRAVLAAGGVAVLELGAGQAGAVAALARAQGFEASTRLDLAGVERALVLVPGTRASEVDLQLRT